MAKAAAIILAGTDGHSNLGRLVNGLETANEFLETERFDGLLEKATDHHRLIDFVSRLFSPKNPSFVTPI